MGLFSFLTGSEKKEEAAERPTASTATETDGTAADASAGEDAGGSTATTDDSATSGRWPETPFEPPGAWNTGALTAPPPPSTDAPSMGPADPEQTAALQGQIVEALKTVYDPEIPVDIYELGLVYEIIVDTEKRVLVKMTLTSPACPSAQQIPSEARFKIKAIPGVTEAWVEIVWEPPWDKDRMSETAKLALGIF